MNSSTPTFSAETAMGYVRHEKTVKSEKLEVKANHCSTRKAGKLDGWQAG